MSAYNILIKQKIIMNLKMRIESAHFNNWLDLNKMVNKLTYTFKHGNTKKKLMQFIKYIFYRETTAISSTST